MKFSFRQDQIVYQSGNNNFSHKTTEFSLDTEKKRIVNGRTLKKHFLSFLISVFRILLIKIEGKLKNLIPP